MELRQIVVYDTAALTQYIIRREVSSCTGQSSIDGRSMVDQWVDRWVDRRWSINGSIDGRLKVDQWVDRRSIDGLIDGPSIDQQQHCMGN